TFVPLRAQPSGDELRVGDVSLLGCAQLLVIHLEHAPQLEILQQLFQFFSHGYRGPYRAAESSRAPHGAESSVPRGPDRRDRTGRLREPRPEKAREDILSTSATVAAGQAPPLCGPFASAPSHTRRSLAQSVGSLALQGADRFALRPPRVAADVRCG